MVRGFHGNLRIVAAVARLLVCEHGPPRPPPPSPWGLDHDLAATVLFGLPAIFAAFVPPRGDWFLRFARGWARTILVFCGRLGVEVLHARAPPGRPARVIVAEPRELRRTSSFCSRASRPGPFPRQAQRLSACRSRLVDPRGRLHSGRPGRPPARRRDGRAALARLREGRSVIVFPEETRTRTGSSSRSRRARRSLAIRVRASAPAVGNRRDPPRAPRGVAASAPGPRRRSSIGEPIDGPRGPGE